MESRSLDVFSVKILNQNLTITFLIVNVLTTNSVAELMIDRLLSHPWQ